MTDNMPYTLKKCRACGKEFLPARFHKFKDINGYYCSNHCYESARDGVRPYRRLGGEAHGNKY